MAPRPPWSVVAVSVLFALLGVVCVSGAFLFAFPLGDVVATAVGSFLLVAAAGYFALAWRLRRGERWAWGAAVGLPLAHEGVLVAEFLWRYGGVPREDVPFLVLGLVPVVLLLLPRTRRAFGHA